MPRMRSTKQQLKQYLQSPQWRDHLEEIAAGGASHVGPLFSFLLLGPQTMHRAADVYKRQGVSNPFSNDPLTGGADVTSSQLLNVPLPSGMH